MSEHDESEMSSEIDIYEESDEEIIKVISSNKSEITKSKIESNKFYPYLLANMKLPSDFMAHALMMHRVDSFARGAEPLVEDEKRSLIESGNTSYDDIKEHFLSLAIKEVEQGVSPMVYRDPLFDVERHISFLDTEMLVNMIREKMQLSKTQSL
jgi:hypothetical protein